MSEQDKENGVSVEMTPVKSVPAPSESSDLPYAKGDMYVREVIVTSSRYDPEARARAANMTSYIAMVLNVTLTVIKVWRVLSLSFVVPRRLFRQFIRSYCR